jgi:hypothetical protein
MDTYPSFPEREWRTARLLTNCIAQRYGLPAFLQLRPRPNGDYSRIAELAMRGDWGATVPLFAALVAEQLPPG